MAMLSTEALFGEAFLACRQAALIGASSPRATTQKRKWRWAILTKESRRPPNAPEFSCGVQLRGRDSR
jgi:hypothetical protein